MLNTQVVMVETVGKMKDEIDEIDKEKSNLVFNEGGRKKKIHNGER